MGRNTSRGYRDRTGVSVPLLGLKTVTPRRSLHFLGGEQPPGLDIQRIEFK